MAHSPEQNPVSPEALELGYQPEELSSRWLRWFLVAFVVVTVALGVGIWYVMKVMEAGNAREDVRRSALTIDQQPPAPNLQPSVGHDSSDKQDLEAMRQEEDAMFARLGWKVNPQTHEVEIPGDIVQRVAEESRERANGPAIVPTTTGKDSNSVSPGAIPPYNTRPGVGGGQRP